MTDGRAGRSQGRTTVLWWLLLLIGIVLSLVMVWRTQFSGDQFNMLARGWTLAFEGELVPVGLPTSAGGTSPGGLLSIAVGLPLMVWADGRSAALLVFLASLAGYLLLDRTVSPALGPHGRVLLAIFYWLNPWRVHYTAVLWNASYMFFFGAVHAWCAFQMRLRPRFWPSMVLVLIIGLGFQLHSSAMVLAFAFLVLWWRRAITVSWWGVGVGAGLVGLSLLPWLSTILGRPELLPIENGFPLRNLLLLQPFLRGIGYLIRYPSLALPQRVYDLDLAPESVADDGASAALQVALTAVGWLTVLLSATAYWRFLRPWMRYWRRPGDEPVAVGLWLRRYVFLTLVGTLVAFAISPTSVMFWQGFPAFHVAVLPTVLLAAALLRSPGKAVVRRGLAAWIIVELVVISLLCWGSPMFRPPGPLSGGGSRSERGFVRRLSADHPMFHDLGLHDRCGLVIVDEGGWMPDVFREGEKESRRGVEE